MSNEPGRLSIIVVSWESADYLARLAASMNGNLDPADELIVVDNGSADDPEEAARAWGGRRRYRRLDSNLGFGAAANIGVAMAAAETVVLLNPDTELLDAGLATLAEFARANECMAGPRLLNSDGSSQPSASGPVVGPWPWLGAFVPGSLQPRRLLRQTEPWRLGTTTRVTWLSAACIAAPRRLLSDLGPFDPAIHLYAEDMDLGLRAGRAGVASYFCPDLVSVAHRRRGATERRWPTGPELASATNRGAVLRRAFGPRAERHSRAALQTRLALRVFAKRALRRPASPERRELAALRAATAPPPLPASPPRSD